MAIFQAVLLLLLGAMLLSRAARRLKIPYPALLALAGAALACAPFETPIHLDPGLALALFVAPVLLDTAFDASPRDLKANWLPVMGLALFAVALTTVSVAFVARVLAPDLSWAAALTLGAIVAPPDSAAATAVLRQVDPPHRVMVVLEGESLLNDALALLVYRFAAVAAMAAGAFHPGQVAPAFLLSVVGSVAFGFACARLWGFVAQTLKDTPSSIIMQFLTVFGVWIVADRLRLSPVLAMVAYAVVLGRKAPARIPARLRVPSYAVWETAVVVLNALAFLLIGLQLRPILAAESAGQRVAHLEFAAAVLGVVIVARAAWVAIHFSIWRLHHALRSRNGQASSPPNWRAALVVSWCGMRGIVTLAAALALPTGFPHRDLLLLTAFAVCLGTLTLQGLTLRPLLLLLKLKDDGPIEREVRQARVELAKVALGVLEGETAAAAESLRRELEAEHETASRAEAGVGRAVLLEHQLRRRCLERRRERLLELRRTFVIGDDAFHHLEEELDYIELSIPAEA